MEDGRRNDDWMNVPRVMHYERFEISDCPSIAKACFYVLRIQLYSDVRKGLLFNQSLENQANNIGFFGDDFQRVIGTQLVAVNPGQTLARQVLSLFQP